MNYEEFKKELMERLEDERPEFVKAFRETTTKKDNANQYDAIAIEYGEMGMFPTVYPKDFYRDYQEGRPMDDIVENILWIAASEKERRPALTPEDINPENAKECLTLRLINKEWNPEIAEKCAYLEFHDLIAVPRWQVHLADDKGSFLVTRDIQRDNLKMTDEEILILAKKNAMAQGFTVRGMMETLGDMVMEEFDMYGPEIPQGKDSMYVMTNMDTAYGAIGMMSQDVLSGARERMGENYFIIPSSVHEVLFVPESTCDDPAKLKEMCMEVNSVMVDEKERLGENIYHFNGEKLRICNSRDEMIEQLHETKSQTQTHTQKRRMN